MPGRNKFYCHQNKKINGYRILDNNKDDKYEVIAKTVATRSHYRVRRTNDKVAVASIDQGQMASSFTISDETGTELAQVKIPKADVIILKVGGRKYEGKSITRGKQFEFKDKDEQLILTIDKKLLSFSDKYEVAFVEKFPAIVAALLPIVLHDFYHSGTNI